MPPPKLLPPSLPPCSCLPLRSAKQNGRLTPAGEAAHLVSLRHLPVAVQKVLALEPEIMAWAQRFANNHHALFLGRGHHYPIALEGALKHKEISYIHAETYPTGELKQGPLALVDEDMPVISVAPNDTLLDKLKSNLKEVAAAVVNCMSSLMPIRTSRPTTVCICCACRSTTAYSPLFCMWCLCNCFPITSRWSKEPTWINLVI